MSDVIPDGLVTVFDFGVLPDGAPAYLLADYEAPFVAPSGQVYPPVVDLMLSYLDARGSSDAARELRAVVAIAPPDILLADYRSLRIRLIVENFLRGFVDAAVDPTGAASAARVLTAEGKFRKDTISEIARNGLAALASGKDASIAGAVRVFLAAAGGPRPGPRLVG